MRILYITAECVPGNTGGSVHAYEAASHLSKQGQDVTVLCHRADGQKEIETGNGFRIFRSPMRLFGKAFSPLALLRFPHLNEPFDVIMERYYATSFLGAYLSRVKKIPLVLEVNNPHLEELREKKDFPKFLLPAAKALTNMTLRQASLIFTPLKNILPQEFLPKVREISWAVNTTLFHPGTRKSGKCAEIRKQYGLGGKYVAVYAGTFRSWHAVAQIAGAAEIIAAQRKDFCVLMVGKGDLFDDVKRKILERKLQDVCILTGEQPYEDVPDFLGAADIGLAPFALTATMQKQGFYYSPLKIFEYMACGLPVITTKIPSLDGLVSEGKTGFLLPENWTVDDLARLLLRFMSDKVDFSMSGKRAREAVATEFSWNTHVRTLVQEMERLTGKKEKHEAGCFC